MKNVTLWKAPLLVFGYILMLFLCSLNTLFMTYLPDDMSLLSFYYVSRAIQFGADILFATFIVIFLTQIDAWNRIRVPKSEFNWTATGIAMVIGLIFVYIQPVIYWCFAQLPGFPEYHPWDPGEMQFQHWHWFFLVATIIITPIIEESFFRGYIFKSLKKNYKLWVAVLVSSILFGLLHFDWISLNTNTIPHVVSTFLGGIAIALLYHKTDRILYPIIAHMSWNFVAATFDYWEYPIIM